MSVIKTYSDYYIDLNSSLAEDAEAGYIDRIATDEGL